MTAFNKSGDEIEVAEEYFMTCCLCRGNFIGRRSPRKRHNRLTPEEQSNWECGSCWSYEKTSRRKLRNVKYLINIPVQNSFSALPIYRESSSKKESETSNDNDIYHDATSCIPRATHPDFQELIAAYCDVTCVQEKIKKKKKKCSDDDELHALLAENKALVLKIRALEKRINRKDDALEVKQLKKNLPKQVRFLLDTPSERTKSDSVDASTRL